jgi:NCAIR mutase (PurE)-related protein
MNDEDLKKIFQEVKDGKLDIVSALARIGEQKNISDIGFARIDHARNARCGFPEFIYGEGKTAGQIVSIIEKMLEKKHPVLVTRINSESAEEVLKKYPEAEYDKLARALMIRSYGTEKKSGLVLIVTAGTSDLGAALEAKYTAELCGCETELIADSGVAGIHRLFAQSAKLKKADVIIVAAGMEGALPSVVGGLVSCPVIAVPTSVGYGASLNGFTAMFSMLNSCANGITVVNIDNGFGAGCAAARIINSKT